MPELPEVETVVLGLKTLINKTIKKVNVRSNKLRYCLTKKEFDLLNNQTIQSIDRRSKYIVISLDQGFLLIHLGMTGILNLIPLNQEPQKHEHIDLLFENICLRYKDVRRFGYWVYTKDWLNHKLIKKLGVEPLSIAWNEKYLAKIIKSKTKTNIKTLLMNASLVVGIGNIYANEILFKAEILPTRIVTRLTNAEVKKIIKFSKSILAEAIKMGGTTLKDFRTTNNDLGYFSQKLKIYGLVNCSNCGNSITKIQIQQRSTFFCNKCQK